MTESKDVVVVFVHGWSVTDTDTYGGLPHRLSAEANSNGLNIRVEHIRLGKYISFHDEVRVTDIAGSGGGIDYHPGAFGEHMTSCCLSHMENPREVDA